MTDLSEQWKKGELPLGMYYVKTPFGVEIHSDYSLYRYKLTRDVDSIEVLAPVPSYEEWQRIFHYAGKYEHEYTSCVMDYENLKQENQQLKDVISKMCMELVDPDDDMSNGLAEWFNQDLLLEIREVLK